MTSDRTPPEPRRATTPESLALDLAILRQSGLLTPAQLDAIAATLPGQAGVVGAGGSHGAAGEPEQRVAAGQSVEPRTTPLSSASPTTPVAPLAPSSAPRDVPAQEQDEGKTSKSPPAVASQLESSASRDATDREIIVRVDRWFGGALCIAFKSHHEGRPNEPTTYLYRSDVLAGLGITESEPTPRCTEDVEGDPCIHHAGHQGKHRTRGGFFWTNARTSATPEHPERAPAPELIRGEAPTSRSTPQDVAVSALTPLAAPTGAATPTPTEAYLKHRHDCEECSGGWLGLCPEGDRLYNATLAASPAGRAPARAGTTPEDTARLDWLTHAGHSLLHYGANRWDVPDYGVADSPRGALDIAIEWDRTHGEHPTPECLRGTCEHERASLHAEVSRLSARPPSVQDHQQDQG